MKTYILLCGSFLLLLASVFIFYFYFMRLPSSRTQFAVLEKKCGDPTPGTFPSSLGTNLGTPRDSAQKLKHRSYPGKTPPDANLLDQTVWKAIVPKGFEEIFSSDDPEMQKAAIAMRDAIHDKKSFKECKKRLAEYRPPGVVSMDYEMILNVEISNGSLSIVNASIENSTLSDMDFEECILGELKMIKYDFDASPFPARYRFKYGFRFILEVPSTDPNKPPLTGEALAKAAQEFRNEWEKAKKQSEKDGVPIEDVFGRNIAIERLPSSEPGQTPSN